ncbi:MAG: hypothetical protein BGO69_09880 [Bacteroidetes bacterium 46-16]|nr:MAG: hypothetical protein BGO69_09880 [Bacteroidetes bacterium 46-16]
MLQAEIKCNAEAPEGAPTELVNVGDADGYKQNVPTGLKRGAGMSIELQTGGPEGTKDIIGRPGGQSI